MLFSPSKCFFTLFHSFSYLPADRNLPCAGVRPRNALDKKNKLTHTLAIWQTCVFFTPSPSSSLFLSFLLLKQTFSLATFPMDFHFPLPTIRCRCLANWKSGASCGSERQRNKTNKSSTFFLSPPHSCRICIMRCASNWRKLLYPAGAKTVRAISGKRIAAGDDKIDVNNVVPNKWVSGLSF